MSLKKTTLIGIAILMCVLSLGISGQTVTPFVSGLKAPGKVIYSQRQQFFLVPNPEYLRFQTAAASRS